MSPIKMETNAIATAKAIVELMADLLFIWLDVTKSSDDIYLWSGACLYTRITLDSGLVLRNFYKLEGVNDVSDISVYAESCHL